MTTPPITGRTRVCFLVGDPIVQARTPQALNALARERGLDVLMMPLHVAASQLRAVLAGCRAMQNLTGLVITVPHKVAAVQLCDDLTLRAKLAGAVNVIRRDVDHRLQGDLVDGLGFVGALGRNGYDPAGRSAYVAGAGGAARAIAFALAETGVARIGVANRTEARAMALVDRLRHAFPGVEAHCAGPRASGYDLVVNATTLGLRADDDLPLDVASLRPDMFVADAVMHPPVTPLLKFAAERGCRTQRGHAMLEAQLGLLAQRLGFTAGD
jgi:shikimate dehydrogenase